MRAGEGGGQRVQNKFQEEGWTRLVGHDRGAVVVVARVCVCV